MAAYSEERKGSLFLRSDSMNYSRATLNSNWHQAREAEPKDYDLSNNAVRDLCKASYVRIGNATDGSLPQTTYQDFTEQSNLKDSTEKDGRRAVINSETVGHSELDRETGTPKTGFGSVLPSQHPEHDKLHLDTTYLTDYTPPYPYTPAEERSTLPGAGPGSACSQNPSELADYTLAYKKCLSQFADTANHRRGGRNTWQDESGVYTNSHFKAECPTYTTKNPILRAYAQEAE